MPFIYKMITEKEIMRKVKAYAATPEGKKKIKERCGVKYDEKWTTRDAKRYGEMMKQILFEHTNKLISSVGFGDIVVSEPMVNKDGRMMITVGFKEGSLHRPSLYPQKYPEGLENIVLLFAHGYHARNHVFGEWDGNRDVYEPRMISRISREPNGFLKDAIEEFNQSSNGIAVATLQGDYSK